MHEVKRGDGIGRLVEQNDVVGVRDEFKGFRNTALPAREQRIGERLDLIVNVQPSF
jgi:hypothetical protein